MLWLYDRCLRIVSGATPVELKRAYYDHDAGVVRLSPQSPPVSAMPASANLLFFCHCFRAVHDLVLLCSSRARVLQTVLEWAKPGFKHKAGQYAWIAVPCISHLEWSV